MAELKIEKKSRNAPQFDFRGQEKSWWYPEWRMWTALMSRPW